MEERQVETVLGGCQCFRRLVGVDSLYPIYALRARFAHPARVKTLRCGFLIGILRSTICHVKAGLALLTLRSYAAIRFLCSGAWALEDFFHALHKLFKIERLRQIVVGTCAQSGLFGAGVAIAG